MVLKLSFRRLIITCIILLPVLLGIENKLGFQYISYFDEVMTVIGFLYILINHNELDKYDRYILLGLIFFQFIGIISTYLSDIYRDVELVIIAAFVHLKIFICFIWAKLVAAKDVKHIMWQKIRNISIWTICVSLVFGVISQFVVLNMGNGEIRYGIRAYSFLFGNEGRFGIIIACCFLVILMTERNKLRLNLLLCFTIINIILSTKGVAIVIIALYFVFTFLFKYFEKGKKFSYRVLIPLFLSIVVVSKYQIQEYLLNSVSVRRLLIKYGFITANNYFPLGAGFSTYGSEQASSVYSPLYVRYGWSNKYSMGINSPGALQDSYFSSILGETGYIGVVLFLGLLFLIFRQINNIRLPLKQKAFILALFIDMLLCFFATGITKSSIGVLVFVLLGICVGHYKRECVSLDDRK